jgi:uncharacterized protein involved in tolerance to divalent cations
MIYNFNLLERRAREFLGANQPAEAMKIYLFMADGDQSLDAGYLGEKIGHCCELLGDLHAAYYWYGRAVEENPEVRHVSQAARARLADVAKIDDLLM